MNIADNSAPSHEMSDLQINPVDDGFDSLLLGFDFDEDLMNEMAIPEDVFRISGPVFKEVTDYVAHPDSSSSSSSSMISMPSNSSSGAWRKPTKVVKASKKSKSSSLKEVTHNGQTVIVSTRPMGFPTYDRTNFLMHLPTFISKCQNTGDLKKMRETIASRASKDCVVIIPEVPIWATTATSCMGSEFIARFYEVIQTYFPDSISCVTSISSWSGEIRSAYVFKKTDCKQISDLVNSSATSDQDRIKCDRSRYLSCMDLSKRSFEEVRALRRLVASDETFTVHGAGVMKIAFDANKKIQRFEITCKIMDLVKDAQEDMLL